METQELQIVTYEQAVKLKELGFDWECTHCYYNEQADEKPVKVIYKNHNNGSSFQYSAPTVALALKWFRDVKCFFGNVNFSTFYFRKGYYFDSFSFENRKIEMKSDHNFNSYEAAEIALLDELLKMEEKI
jgi:hypothetical protein